MSPEVIYNISIFFLSFSVVYLVIPPVIKIAIAKNLHDDPGHRKVHAESIPNLGGLAIFCSFLFSTSLFIDNSIVESWNYIVAALIIVFAIGLKDDIIAISPTKKFIAQILAGCIIFFFTDIRLDNMYGILNILTIPYAYSCLLTIVTIIVITNSFNLIDGIDGLAGLTGMLVTSVLGFLFFQMGQTGISMVSFAISGCCLGFLFFNYSPAKIFMGDTGALVIGFLIAVLSIKFIQLNQVYTTNSYQFVRIVSAPALMIAILIVPLFDTLRIFIIRIMKVNSPFKADSNHIHHRLVKLGLSHGPTSLILFFFNIVVIIEALFLQHLGNLNLMLIVLFTAMFCNTVVSFSLFKKTSVAVKPEFKNHSDNSSLFFNMRLWLKSLL